MFYIIMHNTFLMVIRVVYMEKELSDSKRGNPLLPIHGLTPIRCKGSFICTIPEGTVQSTACFTPVVEHWLERDIVQWGKKR